MGPSDSELDDILSQFTIEQLRQIRDAARAGQTITIKRRGGVEKARVGLKAGQITLDFSGQIARLFKVPVPRGLGTVSRLIEFIDGEIQK